MLLASIGDSLKVWSPDGSQPGSLAVKTRFAGRNDSIYHSLCWSHNNKVVAVGGNEPKVDLVRVKNGQLLLSLALSESKLSNVQVRAVAFSPDSRYLACALGSPIQLWDMEAPNIKAVFTGHTHHIVSLQFTSTGAVFSADKSGKIKLWTAGNSSPLHELSAEPKRQLTCMTLSPIDPLVAAGFADGGIKVWNAISSAGPADTLVRSQQCHADRVTAIACSTRNARLISTVSADGKLQLVDLGSKSPHELTAVCDTHEALTALAFHEDGVHCAVGTATGSLCLFDWRALRQPLLTLPAHTPHAVTALAYPTPHVKAKDPAASSSSMASARTATAHTVPASPAPTPVSEAAGPPPSPASRTERVAEDTRPGTQLEVGGHPRPSLAVEAVPTPSAVDGAVDVHFEQARLHTQLDRRVHRSADSALGSVLSEHSVHTAHSGQLDDLRQSVKPVTAKELDDALELLRYDLHNEVQEVLRDQVRQFVLAKEETAQLVRELSCQLAELLQANKELRAENERLRRILLDLQTSRRPDS